MPNLGGMEIVLVLVVVLIVFGAGKLPNVLGQLGKGVRTFREEAQNDDPKSVSTTTTTAAAGKYCASCGKANADGAKFCASCGTPLAA